MDPWRATGDGEEWGKGDGEAGKKHTWICSRASLGCDGGDGGDARKGPGLRERPGLHDSKFRSK